MWTFKMCTNTSCVMSTGAPSVRPFETVPLLLCTGTTVSSVSATFLTSNLTRTAGTNISLSENREEPSGGQEAPSSGHRCSLPHFTSLCVCLSVQRCSKTLFDQASLFSRLCHFIYCSALLFFQPVYFLIISALVSSHGSNHPGVLAHFIASSSCFLYFGFFASDIFTLLNFAVFVSSCCRNVEI